jgi:hypothetical protein
VEVEADRPVPVVEDTVRPALPWAFSDLRRVSRAVATGLVGLFVGWVVASGTADVEVQGYAVAGGVVVAAFLLAGCAGWLLAGLHACRAERARLLAAMAALLREDVEAVTAQAGLVTARGMTRAHLATCVMVRGKELRAARSTDGLAPCPMCLVEQAGAVA